MSGLDSISAATGKVWSELLRERPPAPRIARLPYYRWLVVGTVCIGAFMGQLDASIAQLVLPVLERDFHQHLSAISWVAVSYTLTLAVLLPMFGRLADLYGRKMLYTGGFVVFIIGSALCGFAPNLPLLIGARVFQAIGAALLQTNSVAIVVTAAGERHRGRAIGLQATAQAVGLSTGPALGGFLIHTLSWRWVFWINVPFGLLGAIIGWYVLPQTVRYAARREFDWGGALLLAPALTALVLAIDQGHDWGLRSPAFLICAVAPFLLVPMFVLWERRHYSPLLDLNLFRRHAFWAGNVTGLLSYAMLFGIFFLMPFVFERTYHENSLTAGLQLMVVPVCLGVVSPLAGALYDRIGPRWLTGIGMVFSLCAFIWLGFAMTPTATSMAEVTGALALFGLGQGLFTSPNNSSVMGAAAEANVGQAGGVLNVTRSFGTSAGVAATAAVVTWRLAATIGPGGNTIYASPQEMLGASHYVLAMFSIFAVIACVLSWMRPNSTRGPMSAEAAAEASAM